MRSRKRRWEEAKKRNGAKVGAVREPPLPKTALTAQPPLPLLEEGGEGDHFLPPSPLLEEGEKATTFSPLS